MAADRLVISQEKHNFYIQWYIADEGDLGGYLTPTDGQEEPPATDRGNWEHWAACKSIVDLGGVFADFKGFYWETKREAQEALRIANTARQQERPMPDWAKQALKAGWKPPKGWKA